MEVGFVADSTYGGTLTSKWVEGQPERSFWTGTIISGKTELEIKTFRCPRCGYLESYAF
jgi:hypothetical protein